MTTRYSMLIQWSDEDQLFIVSLPEFGRFCKTHGATYEEAVAQGHELIDSLIETYQAQGWNLPRPEVFPASQLVA